MFIKYLTPALTVFFAILLLWMIYLGVLSSQMGILMLTSILVMGFLLQIIIIMRLRIKALHQYAMYLRDRQLESRAVLNLAEDCLVRQEKKTPKILQSLRRVHEKENRPPIEARVEFADMVNSLRDSRLFQIELKPLKKIPSGERAGYFAQPLYKSRKSAHPLKINRLIVEAGALSSVKEQMMIFARILFVLYQHCKTTPWVMLDMPIALIDNAQLPASLKQMRDMWSVLAKRLGFVLQADDFFDADRARLRHFHLLRDEGVRFGVHWDKSLLKVNLSLLRRRGVTFVVVPSEAWVALYQEDESREDFFRLNERIKKYEIAWIVDGVESQVSDDALMRQGVNYVIGETET